MIEKIDARFVALESSVEFLKKVTSEWGVHIAEIKKSVEDMGEIKDMLASWMKKQGISPEEEDTNSKKGPEEEVEGGGPNEELETTRSWVKKVELPSFEGSDPLDWVARIEKFFEVQQVKSSVKPRLAFISMEGNTVHWFQYWRQKAKNPSWEEFVTTLLRRFSGNGRGTVFERLATLRQMGNVEDYVQEFELLVAQAPSISEDQLLGYFLTGLRQDIRGQVRPHDTKDLTRAMEVARDIEEAMKEVRSFGGASSRNPNTGFMYQGGGGIVSRVGTLGGANSAQSSNGPGRNS